MGERPRNFSPVLLAFFAHLCLAIVPLAIAAFIRKELALVVLPFIVKAYFGLHHLDHPLVHSPVHSPVHSQDLLQAHSPSGPSLMLPMHK